MIQKKQEINGVKIKIEHWIIPPIIYIYIYILPTLGISEFRITRKFVYIFPIYRYSENR